MDNETTTEQAETPSVQDRIASILEGKPRAPSKQAAPKQEQAQEEPQTETEDTASEPQEANTEPETFDLEIDGEKFTLPKKLEKGFMQEKDYTQKSQTLAEQRRQIELQHQQNRIASYAAEFDKATSQERQDLAMLETVIRQSQTQDVSGWELDKLIRHRMDLDNLKERKAQLEASIDGKRKEFGEKQSREIEKARADSLDVIRKRIPGFNDDTAKAIRKHALSEGYSDAELDAILDPRHAVTLWKAQQYDSLKSSAKPAVANAKNVKTTSTSNPMPQNVKDKLAFRKAMSKADPTTQEGQRLVKQRIGQIFG